MEKNPEKLNKVIQTAYEIEKFGSVAIAKQFSDVNDKIETISESFQSASQEIKDELKKKLDEELVYEVDEEKIVESVFKKLPTPQNGKDGVKGKDGKNYILTDLDKLEIADKIEVPIVEKIIEKTETIIEKPIESSETGETIVSKINELPTDDEDLKIDAKHIKNFDKSVHTIVTRETSGGSSTPVDLTPYVPYSGLSASNVTANTLTYFNGSKEASSVTLGAGLSFSGGTLTNTGILDLSSPLGTINIESNNIDVNQAYPFGWTNDHRYDQVSVIIQSSSDSDAVNGLVLKNSESENKPFLKFENNAGDSYIGFIAPNFEASQPHFLWTLPEQDASGVWKSDGAGFMSIAPVTLTSGTDVTGILPYANGGTNSSTSFTASSVIFAGATGFEQDNTNFRWDKTNKRLGIGATPSYKIHVSGGDSITGYFTSSAGSTRLGVNNATNTGVGFYVGGALKWSQAVVNGGGAGTNPDLVFYNDQTSTNALWIDGNNNNVSIGLVAPSTTNKLHVTSTYTTSASRIAYFLGTSGTSGIEVRTNGNAQYMARSSTHANSELRFQQYSDGNAYFGTVTMSGTLSNSLYIRTSADSGTNTGSIYFQISGTQKAQISSTGISIGSGAVTPSAYLTLGAGTATAGTAPMKLTSGTNTTTAVAGQVEYNGTNLFFTRTGSTRENVFVGNDGATAPSTTATPVFTDFYGGNTKTLGDPVSWASVVISGTTYKIPLYT